MQNIIQSFKTRTGAAKLQHPLVVFALLLLTFLLGVIVAKGGIKVAIALIASIPFIFYLNRLFNKPAIGIYTLLVLGFIAIGLTRYFRGVPLGLTVDGTLVITYIALFFNQFSSGVKWDQAARDLTYLMMIWYAYAILEFFNPMALSRTAWFYAMRGFSLYPLLIIPLSFILFNRLRHLSNFLYIWGVFAILGTLNGLKQYYIGLDPYEQWWLDNIGGITHMIFGELRVFSFFSDAGQFGAAQGAAGIVGALVAASIKSKSKRIFFIIMSVMGFWGMFLSGTRGAMIVPMLGGVVYILLKKNFKVLAVGGFLLLLTYLFFAHTYIGQSNAQIRRMRTAFRPEEDASYLVRLENRRILGVYLKDKPFGGGIGSAGDWGKRFSPQGFLANVATDSWYVQIWAEQGIIGLILHLFILSYIFLKGLYLIWFKVKNPELNGVLGALLAGFIGIMGASYGNGVLGQMPTGILTYLSWGFIFMATQLDREYSYLTSKGISPWSLNVND
jgi:hypothetical protein